MVLDVSVSSTDVEKSTSVDKKDNLLELDVSVTVCSTVTNEDRVLPQHILSSTAVQGPPLTLTTTQQSSPLVVRPTTPTGTSSSSDESGHQGEDHRTRTESTPNVKVTTEIKVIRTENKEIREEIRTENKEIR